MSATVATAAVLTKPRTFELREFPVPRVSADDGLLRVEACGLCGTDYEQYTGGVDHYAGKPLIPGHEILGFVEDLGPEARAKWGLAPGDRVTVEGSIPCGVCDGCRSSDYSYCGKMTYGISVGPDVAPGLWGGYATHMYLHPNAQIHRVPADIPTDVMTLFNPLSGALQWTIVAGGVGLGTRVVICGPGQRGLLAVLAAKEAGADQIIVTGTKQDHHRLEVARSLGATTTIDVDEADPVEIINDVTGGKLADVVIDITNRSTRPILQAVEIARRGGKIVLAGIKGPHALDGLMTDRIVNKELHIVGVVSSSYATSERAIRFIQRHRNVLATLAPRGYPLAEVTTAVRTLGREIYDPQVLHQHLRMS